MMSLPSFLPSFLTPYYGPDGQVVRSNISHFLHIKILKNTPNVIFFLRPPIG